MPPGIRRGDAKFWIVTEVLTNGNGKEPCLSVSSVEDFPVLPYTEDNSALEEFS